MSRLGLLLSLVALGGYAISAGALATVTAPEIPAPRLRFGQSIALSDLDGDNAIDQATLGVAGFSKSIRVSLSSTRASSLLQFTTASYNHGSLFACDIDNDGDIDLVWTDLVNPNDVVVWINDGSGRFQRGSERYCTDKFILGTQNLDDCSRQPIEVGVSQPDRNSFVPAKGSVAISRTGGKIISTPPHAFVPSFVSRVVSTRGPPLTLC